MSYLDNWMDDWKKAQEKQQIQLGFAKGQAKLYENALTEIEDLKRQLEDEKKVRQIMREAVAGHADERDSIMEHLHIELMPAGSPKFTDLTNMGDRLIVKFMNMKRELEELRGKLAEALKSNAGMSVMQDYIIETNDGRNIGYKAQDAASAIRMAQRDGYNVYKSYTKEEYELKKWG